MKFFTTTLCLFLFICPMLHAQQLSPQPIATDLTVVERLVLPQIDNTQLYDQEMKNRKAGQLPHFAHKFKVEYNAESSGTWEYLQNGTAVWRLRIISKDAKSLNFGFGQYKLSQHAKLILYTADYKDLVGPLTVADNKEHERLWTPVVLGDDVIIEVQLPQEEVADFFLELTEVNHDFMGINSMMTTSACHIDVACGMANGFPEIEAYRDMIQGVAMYTLNGERTCSGVLISNTNQDCRPFFLTANHCSINEDNAASIVAYWNYENTTCRELGSAASGGEGDGGLSTFNTGAQLRANTAKTDMALIEFDNPVPAAANAFFAGWNLQTNMPTKVVGIHHPQSMEKRISFENDPSVFQGTNGGTADAAGNFLIIPDWDFGITEVGSSGSPLFDQDGFVIGQLFGGPVYEDVDCAAGGQEDYYGWINKSWEGAGTPDSRLKDWLDPQGTGETKLPGKYQTACQSLAVTDTYKSACALDVNQISYDLTAGSGANNVMLSVFDVPGAAVASLGVSTLQSNQSTTVTLSNIGALSTGIYKFGVEANVGGEIAQYFLYLELLQDVPAVVSLSQPANGAVDAQLTQSLSWNAISNINGYDVQIAKEEGFQNIVSQATGLTATNFLPGIILDQATTYYWRVRGANACGTGEWSNTFSFTTFDNDFQGCITLNAIDLPLTIDVADSGSYPSKINFPFGSDDDVVDKIRITEIKGTHTWVGDLTFTLTSPKGTVVTLIDEECFNSQSFNISFDDLAVLSLDDLTCPYENGDTYAPQDSLANFKEENPNGDWILTVTDGVPDDGGTFDSWTIEICLKSLNANSDLIPASSINLFPNPTRNSVFLNVDHQINAAKIGVTIFNLQGSQVMATQLAPSNRTELDVSNLAKGMYIVQLRFEDQMINKKLIIN